MSKKYRYPGVQPFTRAYQDVFFGRNDDAEELIRRIKLENLLVFYGKSGLGKTSLLNAAVLPELEKAHNYYPILLRFNNYDEGTDLTPTDIFNQTLAGMSGEAPYLEAIPVGRVTLWQALKRLQLTSERYASGRFLLVFDQFEEFFTYPEGTEDFASDLSDLLNGRIPKEFRKNYRRAIAVDEELQQLMDEERKEKLFTPLEVKVVISIRSDRLSFLDQIKTSVPDALKNTYELKPLNAEQAKEAIIKPAQLEGDFASPRFDYSQDTLNRIIAFLQKDHADRKRKEPVESFQLQIICRHIENKIVEGEITATEGRISVDPEDIDINLDAILEAYYEGAINRLPDEQQHVARKLIEEGLILEDEQRRTSLDRGVLKSRFPEVSSSLLKKLVASHLLRAEPNSFGSISYELSHDTLVEPVLRKKRERQQEEKLRQEQLEKERQAEEHLIQVKQRQKRMLNRTIWIASIIIIFLMSFGLYKLKSAYDQEAQARHELELANDSIRSFSRTRAGQLKLEISELNSELEHDSISHAREKKEMVDLRNTLVNNRDATILQLRKIKENKEQTIDSLEKFIIAMTNQRDTLQNTISGLETRMERRDNLITNLRDTLGNQKTQIKTLRNELQAAKNNLKDLQETKTDLTYKVDSLDSKVGSLKSNLTEAQSLKSDYKAQRDTLEARKKRLENRLNEMSDTMPGLKNNMNNLQKLLAPAD